MSATDLTALNSRLNNNFRESHQSMLECRQEATKSQRALQQLKSRVERLQRLVTAEEEDDEKLAVASAGHLHPLIAASAAAAKPPEPQRTHIDVVMATKDVADAELPQHARLSAVLENVDAHQRAAQGTLVSLNNVVRLLKPKRA